MAGDGMLADIVAAAERMAAEGQQHADDGVGAGSSSSSGGGDRAQLPSSPAAVPAVAAIAGQRQQPSLDDGSGAAGGSLWCARCLLKPPALKPRSRLAPGSRSALHLAGFGHRIQFQ